MPQQAQVFFQPHHELDEMSLHDADSLGAAVEQNVTRLILAGEVGHHLVPAYLAAVRAEPGIAAATLTPYNAENIPRLADFAGATLAAHQSPSGRPDIRINTDSWQKWADIRQQRQGMVKEVARKYGVEAGNISVHILARFVLLHECGHVNNYVLHGFNPRTIDAERSKGMKTLPMPHQHPPALIGRKEKYPRRVESYLRRHHERLALLGISSAEQLIAAQEQAYRNIPDEDIADRFALWVMRSLPFDRDD